MIPGKWQDSPAACPPASDAEIAKRYPQFNL